jgi:hypothetical protein
MKTRIPGFLALLILALRAPGPAPAVPAKKDAKQKEIANLVERLGSPDRIAVDEAVATLPGFGTLALPALRQAAKGKNAQVRKRAAGIITAIQDKGEKVVKDKLTKYKAQGYRFRQVSDASLERLFPTHLFYSVVFSPYPVARPTPEPLKAQNLFVVGKDYSLKHITDIAGLIKVFRDYPKPDPEEAAIKEVTRAWLTLAVELYQDGYFQFAIPKGGIKVAKAKKTITVTGKSEVAKKNGDSGALEATLTYDAAGKLTKVDQTAKLRAGMRPICQATRLLDADPLVRRMAEKDLLIMGRAAREYLDEQRARARNNPALQKAIDRVWKRIVAEGW